MSLNPDDQYIETLVTASHECVNTCTLLQQVVLAIPLTSPFAPDVHKLMWTIGNVETALHQFIDRELLHEPYARRRENGGARLQDAIEAARGSLKPTVKASLLAGGIASLLHLFAHTLVRLNRQLEAVLSGAGSSGVSWVDVSAVVAAYAAASAVPPRQRLVRRGAMAAVAVLAGRVAALRLRQIRLTRALRTSSSRLALTLQLWHLATSVLQRAHRAVATSYIELDRLDRRDSSSSTPGSHGGLAGSLGGIGNASGLGLNNLLISATSGGGSGGGGGGGGSGGGGMTSSRSYPQLIARP